MTETEIQQYKSLRQEYLVAFKKDPLPFEVSLDLPFCGVNESAAEKHAYASDSVIENQFYILNDSFAPLGISFVKASTTRYTGDEYRAFTQHKHTTPEDPAELRAFNKAVVAQNKIKAEVRKGGFDEANIYIVEQIDDWDCIEGSITSGYCSFPNKKLVSTDGCVIVIDSLPGHGFRSNFGGDGKTLVHELGHWFGVRPPFAVATKPVVFLPMKCMQIPRYTKLVAVSSHIKTHVAIRTKTSITKYVQKVLYMW
ncbi:hypothetical protein OHC33_011209 [Knufia fluminis]|uniref:Metalloprotease n=1 Tax=Knufia fluminis TaxID=191047 RepID=A0AAN8E891_9EURO|nr:hypothetical protein OHC33_011209 [Knufia fluminis]